MICSAHVSFQIRLSHCMGQGDVILKNCLILLGKFHPVQDTEGTRDRGLR